MLAGGPAGSSGGSRAGNAIEEIKDRLSIVDVVSARVPLKKAGRTLKGLCPFHSERTPSFIVFPDKGNYHCFGCGANGDVFTFVQRTENLEFAEVLRLLAERAGVTLRPRQAAAQEERRREQLYELNLAAAQFYQHALRTASGREALAYLTRRAITDETAEQYQLGWAPDSFDALRRYLVSRGHEPAVILEAGLAVERDGHTRDLLRARVTFPIRDEHGRITGFGARTLGDAQPKYLNTPATPVFDKGGSLYGIDVARAAIRQAGRAVIVEGYVDVLIAHQSGIRNVTGALGTALTERQVAILKRLTRHLVLALDPDAAGEAAALRGLEVARRAYGSPVPVPLPNGLVRLEQRLDADLRIAMLPAGLDPDEVIRRDPAEWHRAIDGAKPVVEFYFDAVLRKADLSSARGTSEAAHQLLPIVGELRDQVQQSFYLRRLAQRLGVSEQLLASELSRLRLGQSSPRAPNPPHQELARAPARPGVVLDAYYVELALESFRKTGRLPDHLDVAELAGSVEGREVLDWLQRLAEAGQLDPATLEAAGEAELPEPLARWLAERLRGNYGTSLLYEAELGRELERCAREVRRRNLRWRGEDLAELLRQAAEESEMNVQRDYLEAAEALLTQLQPYELSSARSSVWRHSPPVGREPQRGADEPADV